VEEEEEEEEEAIVSYHVSDEQYSNDER